MSDDGPLRDPGIPDGERTRYRALVGDRPAAEGTITVAAEDRRYTQRIEGSLAGALDVECTVDWRRRNGRLLAERYELATRDDGKPVSREEAHFRDVRVPLLGGELGSYPRSLTPLPGAALALRGLDWEAGHRHAFALWFAGPAFWEVEAQVVGEEEVDVPAGRHDAWLVRLEISLVALGLALERAVNALLPPIKVHFAAEPPHRMLRLSFPSGPFPDNPRGRVEAVEL